MPIYFNICIFSVIVLCASILMEVNSAFAAMDPRFEIDPQSLAVPRSNLKPPYTPPQKILHSQGVKLTSKSRKGSVHTVKSGDNLFKILMRDYSLSNDEAESFLEDIKRENNIYDLKRIRVGQKIIIPPFSRSTVRTLKPLQRWASNDVLRNAGSDVVPGQSFKLESPVAPFSEQEVVHRTLEVWNRIIPPKKDQLKPLALKTSTFSLTLDPERYPTFARMDGGRIVLDQNGSIPPLVKSLIEDKDASVRIVTGTPTGAKPFMASLLESAGFYSVEENFSLEFGVDPKLTVKVDFKVEKTPESLFNKDVILVNSGRALLPSILTEFIKKEGFLLHEPFASLKPFAQHNSRTIYQVTATKHPEMIDAILSAFSIAPERGRSVDVFATDNNGISLSVSSERYFERAGERFVVTSFDGDPVNYTLFRILETKGYKVVIIEAQDDFRKISEKIISKMKITGNYSKHVLLQDNSVGYSLQMSGFKLDDAMLAGGGVFLTDIALDRVVRELFTENGYNINSR